MYARPAVFPAALCILIALSTAAVFGETTIVVNSLFEGDDGITLAVGDLADAVRAQSGTVSILYSKPGEPLPGNNLIQAGYDLLEKTGGAEPHPPDSYRIVPQALQGSRVLRVEGDVRGLMYGLFKLTELCDYAHARHIDLYLQLYEIQYPPRLDELYDVSLDSPNIGTIVSAKTRELFERVPLDGLIITATETHPRGGYLSKQLWSDRGQAGAGAMLTLYHNACAALGKRAVFRMWRIAGDARGVRNVLESTPGDAMFAIKNTGSDFYLSFPTTDAITDGVGREQPMMVIFDTFREFDGWSRLFCYMKRWGEVVKSCRDNGVAAIDAWGAWSPGCIWPDWDPDYLTDSQGNPQQFRVSWIGHWKQFRMFTRGFTPGQANAYLLGRLMWSPDTDVRFIAHEFAALHIGRDNAEAAADALIATEDAFRELYPGDRAEVTHPVHMKWTMVFGPRDEMLETAFANYPLDKLLESNDRALGRVRSMEDAFARTSPDETFSSWYPRGEGTMGATIESF